MALDEFQDIRNVTGLEGKLRAEIQSLDQEIGSLLPISIPSNQNKTGPKGPSFARDNIPVILLGSKRHILRDIFHHESNPFYGFGTDVEIKEIARGHWLPYMRERFEPCHLKINDESANEICGLMKDVPIFRMFLVRQ